MAISDIFTADSALVTFSSTSQAPLCVLKTASTKRAFIVGVRMKIGVTSAAAGNDVLFTLARLGNAGSFTGGTSITPKPHDPSSAAALSAFTAATYTIVPTLGNVLGEWLLPQTTGSMWEEFPPLGYEWVVPATPDAIGIFVTPSVATATPLEAQLVFSE